MAAVAGTLESKGFMRRLVNAVALGSRTRVRMERVKGQVNEGDTILVDHSDGRTFFVKVESGK